MGDLVKYDPHVINGALDVCQQFVADIDKLVEDAIGAVKARTEISGGHYRDAFQSANDRWEAAQRVIHKTVGDFAGALAQSSENMSATDRQWARNFDAIG